jgi:hypothetical protein
VVVVIYGTLVLLLVAGIFVARRNLRLGRGDRRGATRLAAFALAAMIVQWLVSDDHAAHTWELTLFATWTG